MKKTRKIICNKKVDLAKNSCKVFFKIGRKMDFSEVFNIKKTDIISIIGSGGKTSLMNKLAKDLRKKGRVLITTSTKIKRPKDYEADFIYDSFEDFRIGNKKNFIIALGKLIKEVGKFSAVKEEDLLKIKNNFDYLLIEADGARNLPMKMWKDTEPVIYGSTSKVILVFSAKLIGEKISKDFIYNYKAFREEIKEELVNEKVYLKLIKKLVLEEYGVDKFVYFNQAEGREEETKKIITYLKAHTQGIKYVQGSVLKEEIYEN
ncbi:MAG: selenium cofactor biosynthesis protein YqeC [Anaerococcus sp.]|nr:selenium cofactor biosynthesis protein YqeC [Anaerococcus sp.]